MRVTVNEPVEVPGRVLDPGTYTFRLVPSPSNRNLVQIFNEDESELYETVSAIRNYRLTPTGNVVIQLEERAAGAPDAIRAMFYPGDNFGQEFVYGEAPAPMTAIDVQQEEVVVAEAAPPPEPAPAPAPEPAPPEPEPEIAQAQPAPEVQPAPEPAPAPEVTPRPLPATASYEPLIGLLGLLSAAAALGLRAVRARS
jgi:hypothetical protein